MFLKNDRLYFNLGGKLTFYPKQDLSLSTTTFSTIRNEGFMHNSASTLDNNTKWNGSLELDFSYHPMSNSEKCRFIVGVLANNSGSDIFRITNDIVLPENTHTFEHIFSGTYVGAYLGFAYVLNSKPL